jgi:hypothetical protein
LALPQWPHVVAPVIEASGWTELDAVLPGGGWQVGTIVELMPTAIGIGELRLIVPRWRASPARVVTSR